MIDEEHIELDDDPTIGLKSGKAKASRESGGWVPWTEEDMAKYRARWPLGTEARLMFDILHYTHLRLGDASRFGASHMQRTLKTMMVKVATEKSKGRTTATVPVHRDFAVSLAAARNAGILGTGEVFTGKLVKGEIVPMIKKAWAAKFRKFARLAGVNEAKKNCHGVRKCARRGRGLFGLHGGADDGDVRLARSQDAGALHRQSEPGQARDQRDGEDPGLRSDGEHRRSGDADRPEQNSNFRERIAPAGPTPDAYEKALIFQRRVWGWCARSANNHFTRR